MRTILEVDDAYWHALKAEEMAQRILRSTENPRVPTLMVRGRV